jgi:hypothetical protein
VREHLRSASGPGCHAGVGTLGARSARIGGGGAQQYPRKSVPSRTGRALRGRTLALRIGVEQERDHHRRLISGPPPSILAIAATEPRQIDLRAASSTHHARWFSGSHSRNDGGIKNTCSRSQAMKSGPGQMVLTDPDRPTRCRASRAAGRLLRSPACARRALGLALLRPAARSSHCQSHHAGRWLRGRSSLTTIAGALLPRLPGHGESADTVRLVDPPGPET